MSIRRMSKVVPVFTALLALGACGGEDSPPPDYYEGEASAALGAANNKSTCGHCHSNDGTQEGYAGGTLMDIAYHTSFKGGEAATLLDATNACVQGWMGGPALNADDEEWLALEAYMKSISSEAVTTPNVIAPEVLADLAAYEAAYAGGDAAAGADKYNTYCAKCHAEGVVVGLAMAPIKGSLGANQIGYIAQKVRTSGPPPSSEADIGGTDYTPGPMPFFEPTDLSAQDLKDIIAYAQAN